MDLAQLSFQIKHRQRCVGVLLLLTVFFLLFHFHPATASTAQINGECTCLHGTRTQIGIAPVMVQLPLPVLLVRYYSFEPRFVSLNTVRFRSIRGPPVF